jgi:hypothetical protein
MPAHSMDERMPRKLNSQYNVQMLHLHSKERCAMNVDTNERKGERETLLKLTHSSKRTEEPT